MTETPAYPQPESRPEYSSAGTYGEGTLSGAATAPAPQAKRNGSVGIIAALAVGALVGGVSGAGVAVWAVTASMDSQTTSGPGSSPLTVTVNDPDDATLVTGVAAASGPSVITVSVQGGNAAGTGSGVILTEDGYAVTNTHVVTLDGETGNADIRVQTHDGRLYSADLVGTDPITDLAVIKISGDDQFPALEFADSRKLNVGDIAIAIGAPLGLANTVTNGIVSALNRSITVKSAAAPEQEDAPENPDDNGGTGPFDFWEFGTPRDGGQGAAQQATIFLPVIQTDAAINPGNSGGALLDAEGKIIGINVAIAGTGSGSEGQTGNIGVGFAIPSNVVQRIANELIENGEASHGLLGATVTDVTLDPDATTSSIVGASVLSVTGGGAAEQAGLRKGDVITSFNDLPITGSTDLTAQVRAVAAGDTVPLTFVRNGDVNEVDVTLGELR